MGVPRKVSERRGVSLIDIPQFWDSFTDLHLDFFHALWEQYKGFTCRLCPPANVKMML